MTERGYHQPVLRRQVRELLVTDRCGTYLDATFGGGGHTRALLGALGAAGRVVGLDQDEDALAQAAEITDSRFSAVRGNFENMDTLMAQMNIPALHGILMDLGVSSHQLDDSSRGFSYRAAAPLDMRMDRRAGQDAAGLLNTAPHGQLAAIFKNYGDISWAGRLSTAVLRRREEKPFAGSAELVELVSSLAGGRQINKILSRVFQALRIAVNRELEVLKEALEKGVSLLVPGGRLAVIAYHSLEDRMVKRYFREQADPCVCPPDLPECRCGRVPRLSVVTAKAVRPDKEEVAANVRSRSALLRVAEKRGGKA